MTAPADQRDRFEAMFAAHYRDIAAYCRRRCPSEQDAEEAATDVFAIAWRRMGAMPAPPEDRLWLFGVARRVVANQLRAQRRRDRLDQRMRDTPATAPAAEPDPDSPAARAFHSLPEGDRELLALVAWEGLTPAEIARVLGRPVAVVSTRLWRARRRFAHVYEAAARQAPATATQPRSTTA